MARSSEPVGRSRRARAECSSPRPVATRGSWLHRRRRPRGACWCSATAPAAASTRRDLPGAGRRACPRSGVAVVRGRAAVARGRAQGRDRRPRRSTRPGSRWAVGAACAPGRPLVVGGRSAGARVGLPHRARSSGPCGVVWPRLPAAPARAPGAVAARRAARAPACRTLVVQGERDPSAAPRRSRRLAAEAVRPVAVVPDPGPTTRFRVARPRPVTAAEALDLRGRGGARAGSREARAPGRESDRAAPCSCLRDWHLGRPSSYLDWPTWPVPSTAHDGQTPAPEDGGSGQRRRRRRDPERAALRASSATPCRSSTSCTPRRCG